MYFSNDYFPTNIFRWNVCLGSNLAPNSSPEEIRRLEQLWLTNDKTQYEWRELSEDLRFLSISGSVDDLPHGLI